ncbi:MAG: tyrosine-type recombinase/integrase [Lachnospiraceae bacterium]
MNSAEILSTMSSDQILKIARENDTMDEAIICEIYMKKQNKKYLECHDHNIWQGKNGLWYTYLDNPDKERGYDLKKRKNQKSIEDLVIKYYKDLEENPSVQNLFNMWIKRKQDNNEIKPQSVFKYKKDFKRFFKGTSFRLKKVRKVTEDDLDTFIRKCISDYNLTNKGYACLRTLIRGMWKMAKLKKFTDISIGLFFQDIDLPNSMFNRIVREKEKEVFSESEIPRIKDYLDKSDNFYDWGVLLAFETGIRVGELAALEKNDVSSSAIHVTKTEVHYYNEEKKKNVVEIQDMPKTDAGNRHIILTEGAKRLIERIQEENPNGKYLFEKAGRRINYNRFNKRLKKACRVLDIGERTMHKIRKTYGTTLINNNVAESLIAEQMGHADISTTKKIYYYENLDEKSKIKQINKALS